MSQPVQSICRIQRNTGWVCSVALLLALLASPANLAHAGEDTRQFDINAQPLSEALIAFGAQSGALVMASTALTTGRRSSAVSGQWARTEALRQLLKGTGLRWTINADGSFVIEREPRPKPLSSTQRKPASDIPGPAIPVAGTDR